MTNPSVVPDWLLEQLALGELDAPKAAAVRQRLESEPGGLERLAALRRSNDEILGTVHSAVMARKIEDRLRELRGSAPVEKHSPSRAWWGAPVLAAAVLAVLVPTLSPTPKSGVSSRSLSPELDDGRAKGGATPAVRIHRKQTAQPELLAPGAVTRPKDVLQLSYVAGGHRYGMLFSIDGRGGVTLHEPRSASGPATLQPNGEVVLPFAYELDDAPAFERFFLVYGDAPVSVDAVLSSAKQLAADVTVAKAAPLALPPGLQQVSISLTKVSP